MVGSGVRGSGGHLYRLLAPLVRPRPAHGDGGGQGAGIIISPGRESLSLKMVRQHFLGHFALEKGDECCVTYQNCLYFFILRWAARGGEEVGVAMSG